MPEPPRPEDSAPGEPDSDASSPNAPDTAGDTGEGSAAEEEGGSPGPVIVAIGASAGGLPALQTLFQALPKDTGLAFVVILHLAPDHESMLAEILARHTGMTVEEATEGRRVEADQVYVIPPDRNLGLEEGVLHLEEGDAPHSRRLPLDRFFRALARDQGNRGIGVVLSGSGSDGTLGLKVIKEAGGITFAQDEESAQYPDMPRNAAHRGQVDFIQPPAEIAGQLLRIANHPNMRQALPEQALPGGKALSQIYALLKRQTGHDFSRYKPNTIKRRIQRRLSLNQIRELEGYLRLLRENPREMESLFQDLLINVTGFFRDSEAFDALKEHVFPSLLTDRPPENTLRIWVPGCSTGEEAYSVAIELIEYLGPDWVRVPVQIFATDIDEGAIEQARSATYPDSISADVSGERLRRFFTQVPAGYQVNKAVRDLCVFAVQDVVQDPPFSHLDLISCRNLLIYLETEPQQRLLNIFHFALEPNGFLFLGKSETVGAASDLFSVVDQGNKIYTKRAVQTRLPSLGQGHPTPPMMPAKRETMGARPVQALGMERRLNRQAGDLLLDEYAPPSVVVDEGSEIVTFLGGTGPYFAPAPGRPSWNLFKVVHRDLAVSLRRTLSQATESGREARADQVQIHLDGEHRTIVLRVRPLRGEDGSHYFLVVFEPDTQDQPAPVQSNKEAPSPEQNGEEAETLRQELETTREQMQGMLSEHASTTEELQTANEEVQSANEELQSTNEELATLNNELEARNQDLSRANSDLENLLRNINLPIVMVTEDLCIRQATAPARDLLNLIDSDIGRPLTDLRPRVDLPDLEQLIRGVIDSVESRSLETQDDEGNWYSLNLRPYKDEENRITGAVLLFYEITDLKSDPEQTRRLAAVARDGVSALLVADLNGAILTWNRGAQEHYGFTEQEARERGLWGLVPPEDHQSARDLLGRLRSGERVPAYRARRLTKQGEPREIWGAAIPLRDPTGQVYAVALDERDLSSLPEPDA